MPITTRKSSNRKINMTENTTASGAANTISGASEAILEQLEDALVEWSGYVTADDAPRTLREHASPHIKMLRAELGRLHALEASAPVAPTLSPEFMHEIREACYEAAPVAPAPQPETDSMGIPLSCGGPLCTPKDHHPYCKLAAAPKAAPAELPDAVAHYGGVFTDEQLGMKPAPLQQGEYLPLPEPAIKACHCYSTNQVREAIDADRAARGAEQAAPAEPDMRSVALAAGAYTTAYSMLTHAKVHNADVDGSTKRLVAAINGLRSALGPSAPVAEDAEDAARYRWLREQCQSTGHLTIAKSNSWELQPWSGDDPDSAIDAARAVEKHHGITAAQKETTC